MPGLKYAGKNIVVRLVFYAAAFLIPAILHFAVLARTPLLPGIDGPYYLVQVLYLMRHGYLKYPDPPLVFYGLLAVATLFSPSFYALKVGISLFSGIIGAVLAYHVHSQTGSWLAALAAVAVYAFSPATFKLLQDFWKNLAGFVWVIIAFHLFSNDSSLSRTRILAIVAVTILAGLTHILDLGVIVLYALLVAVGSVLYRDRNRFVLSLGVLLVLAMALSMPSMTGDDVRKGVAFIKDFLIRPGVFTAAVYSQPWIITSIAAALALIILTVDNRRLNRDKIPRLALAATLIILNLPIYRAEWYLRFTLMDSLLTSVVLGYVIGVFKNKKQIIALSIIITASVCWMSTDLLWRGLATSIPPPEYEEMKIIIDKMPKGTAIIVPNTKIRYWIETLYEDVLARPDITVLKSYDTTVYIFDKKQFFKLPPRSQPLFDGFFLKAYIVRRPPPHSSRL